MSSKNGIVLPQPTRENVVGFTKPEISTNMGHPASGTPEEVKASQEAEYAFGLLQPYVAMSSGICPKFPDMTMTPTATFGSQNAISEGTIANVKDGTSDMTIISTPYGVDYYAASYIDNKQANDGAVNAVTPVTDPILPPIETNFYAVRQVACQQLVRNTTEVTQMAGVCMQGNAASEHFISIGGVANAATQSTFAHLRASGQHFFRVFNNPGDIGAPVWLPRGPVLIGDQAQDGNIVASMDNQWLLTEAIGNDDLTKTASQTTVLFSWVRAPSSAAQTVDVQVIRLWEAIPLPDASPIVNPTMCLASVDVSRMAITKALVALPRNAIARNVWRDDGVAQGIVSDVKQIWDTGKRVYSTIKDVLGGVGSFVSGLFSQRQRFVVAATALLERKDIPPDDRRALMHAVDAVRTLLRHEAKLIPLKNVHQPAAQHRIVVQQK